MLKDAFAQTFANFASPQNKALFKALFAVQPSRSEP
jgi:hypothetical protein